MVGADATGAGRPSYEELEALVGELRALVAEQQTQIADLRTRLEGNSRNSSRPPSSDGLSKPPADPKKRSLRRRSGRKQGGQEGREGTRLEPVEVPEEQVEHPPERCECCDRDLLGAESLVGGERRQVFDLPEGPLLRVVEAPAGRCGASSPFLARGIEGSLTLVPTASCLAGPSPGCGSWTAVP